MIRSWLLAVLLLCSAFVNAKSSVNIYAWGNEIPSSLLAQFEKETGIQVNFSTYDSNETMYAKLRASKKNIYDIIIPSGYFVERMTKQKLLTKLDSDKLPNLKNLDPLFEKSDYDIGNQYSVPLVWGTSGIFYNNSWIKNPPTSWQALWQPEWKDQLLMLDDIREIFSLTLISLGYQPNDTDPKHIEAAYKKLLLLVPNIKLFSSDNICSIMIDEDANIGVSWNGDAFKANTENPRIQYVYPSEGFMIWIDCLAIPKNPPHPNEAYQFINFMLRAQSGAEITSQLGYATTNLAGKQLLPSSLRNNLTIFPNEEILKNAHVQRDVGEQAVELYSDYWQKLKLAF
ncbi:MAG: spermidine/putrescine ABC transporter substrate-binding protein [Legionellaceae bacterium]|nr:spermidine/putrescine ABC transporter substrate-binding protein [Legionellaceae bacterium]